MCWSRLRSRRWQEVSSSPHCGRARRPAPSSPRRPFVRTMSRDDGERRRRCETAAASVTQSLRGRFVSGKDRIHSGKLSFRAPAARLHGRLATYAVRGWRVDAVVDAGAPTVTMAPRYAIVLVTDAPGCVLMSGRPPRAMAWPAANNERHHDDRTIDCSDRVCPACACRACRGPDAVACRSWGVGQRSGKALRTRAARCRPIDASGAKDRTSSPRGGRVRPAAVARLPVP